MPKSNGFFLLATCLLAFLLVFPGQGEGAAPQEETKIVRIGTISQNAVKRLKMYKKLCTYLNGQMKDQKVKFKPLMPKDIDQAVTLITKKRLHVFFDSPFPTYLIDARVRKDTEMEGGSSEGLRVLANRWKKGVGEYRAVIFVKKDSPIQKLEELKGQIVGFEDAWSSSACFLPRAALQKAGHSLVELEGIRDRVDPEKVGYVFFDFEENAVAWCLSGKIAAAGLSDQDFGKLPQKKDLRVIHTTHPIPRHLVSVHESLGERFMERMTETLVNMAKSEEGREVLKAFKRTKKFEEIPADQEKEQRERILKILSETGNLP